jgi:hypothetical protein
VDRRTRDLFVILLVVLVAVTAGTALILGHSSPAAPSPPADATIVDGVVVGVDAKTLTDVRTFELRTRDGRVLTFGLGELKDGVAFPPGHLAEHQVTAVPVRVWYLDTGGTLEAIYLQDAPAS